MIRVTRPGVIAGVGLGIIGGPPARAPPGRDGPRRKNSVSVLDFPRLRGITRCQFLIPPINED